MAKESLEPSAPRAYRSPLRERQAAQTRETILLAFADEILENGVRDSSIAAVAARADVAERTVYRHFANVDALIDGLSRHVGERLVELLGDALQLREGHRPTPDDLVGHLPLLYSALSEIGSPAGATAAITLARGSSRDRRRRQEILEAAIAPELAHLPPDEARALFETMYMLAGSVSWFLLTGSAGVSGEQAGRAAARIMRALLNDLRAERAGLDRVDQAQPSGTRRGARGREEPQPGQRA